MKRVAVLAAFALVACEAPPPSPDLILTDARVWTGEVEAPWAEAVAVRGGEIVAVGDGAEMEGLRAPETRVLELDGRFVAPGFIDNHTHFNRAGELLLGTNLLAVADEASLVDSVRAARDRLPEDAWILGGDWGAYEEWGVGSPGDDGGAAAGDPDPEDLFRPHRAMIDSITPETPVLLSRWDRSAFLANGVALERAGVTCRQDGVECRDGRPTGRLSPRAAERVRDVVPPKTRGQRMAEARKALQRLREHGVTSIHDNTPPAQFGVFQELLAAGELTVRVYARPTLDRWEELQAVGIRHGFGNEWLRVGGLKGFVDGIMGNSTARFYEPYLHTGERGQWRQMMERPPGMQELLVGADTAGHWPQVHAIGDQAIDTLLTMFERTLEETGERGGVRTGDGPPERRWRVIHTQVLAGPEVAERMAELDLVAEMQPYHAIDDMRWMEERIGERSRWAYAFRTLDEAGVRLSFGSDWPGTNASWYPASPVLGIYAAVTRQTVDGEPEGGWFPEERVDVETALRAFTVNNAWAAGEEDLKGTVAPGKLADLVVLDRNPFEVAPEELKDLRVDYTILDGEVIHRRQGDDAAAAGAGGAP